MRKPLFIALGISAALHGACIALVPWTFEPPRPAPPPPELKVSLERYHDRGVASSSASEDTASPTADSATAPQAAAATLAGAAKTADGSPPQNPQPPTAEAPEPASSPAALASPAAEKPATATREISQQHLVVATAAHAPQPKRAFVDRERKMLDKKVRKWAETYFKNKTPDEPLEWRHRGQRYSARFTAIPAANDQALDRLQVEVSTEVDGKRLTTALRMKRLAFSNYAQFVNRWDQSVQIHDDELDGRFHANTAINLAYDRKVRPTFHGKVTTSAHRVNITAARGRARRSEMFLGGLQTGVRAIRLPKNVIPLPENAAVDAAQIQEFDEDTRITFHADGSYTWIALQGSLFERRGHLRAPASYLLAADDAKLHVRGTVRGKVLVYSPKGIVIAGNLLYAQSDRPADGREDFLGLVSAQNVEIAAPQVTGPGDLEIHAAIYAKRRFAVTRFSHRNRGVLSIYGSLTAGSLSATEPRYATKIRFDPRLDDARPPGFPVTNRYELEDWDRAWTVDN